MPYTRPRSVRLSHSAALGALAGGAARWLRPLLPGGAVERPLGARTAVEVMLRRVAMVAERLGTRMLATT